VFNVCIDVLRSQYSDLATKLDAHVAAVHMYQRNALTVKDLQSIQSLRDRPVEAAKTLLNIILEQSDAIYLCFLDVLKHSGQQHIYQTLVEGGYKGEYSAMVSFYASKAIRSAGYVSKCPGVLCQHGLVRRVFQSITLMQRQRHHMTVSRFCRAMLASSAALAAVTRCLSVCLFVCPSVHHVRGFCQNK